MIPDELGRRSVLAGSGAILLSGCTGLLSDSGGGQSTASLSMGESMNATLEEGDGTDPVYDDLAEPVTFEAEADSTVTITMRSEAFDAYLLIEDWLGNKIAENDDGDAVEGLDSQITETLHREGTYTIWAGSLSGSATGEYSLALEEGQPANPTVTPEPGTPHDGPSIAVGESMDGRLEEGDGRDPRLDNLAEPVAFEGEVNSGVTFTMRSEAFDAHLVLENPSGHTAGRNDDGDDVSGTTSQFTQVLSETGTYTIWAGSSSGDATGPYTLSVSEA